MPWDWDQHSSLCRRLGFILWGLIPSPSPLPPSLLALSALLLKLPWRNLLCDPELELSLGAASLNLWAVYQQGGGAANQLLWKKGQEMAHVLEEWLPLATPREHSGSQIRWDNQWLYNSLQIHTLPLQEKKNSWAQFHASPSNTSITAICLKKQGHA